jgi:hypothetical protein
MRFYGPHHLRAAAAYRVPRKVDADQIRRRREKRRHGLAGHHRQPIL